MIYFHTISHIKKFTSNENNFTAEQITSEWQKNIPANLLFQKLQTG